MNQPQLNNILPSYGKKPRHGGRSLPGAISLLTLALAFSPAMADTGTLASNASDAQVNSASGVLSVNNGTATFNHVGGSNGTQQGVVYAFQIPSSYLTDHSQQFSAATFSTKLGSLGTMTINGDLYGIGYGPTPTVAASDYFEGTLDTANTLIQDNFLNPTLTSYATPSTSSATLVSYLNACLTSARADGLTTAYVLFRINPDSYIYGNYYLIGMSEATGGYAPSLSYTTAPIPGWTTVPLGGGGYVTGLVCNGDGSAIYCRTDVGGAFRWVPALDGVNGTWASITDAMVPYGTAGAAGLMNVEGIGIDPSNLNQVYVGAGANYSSALRGIFSSSDRGATWTQINTTIRMSGNSSAKGPGERLAVDPNDPNIVWYGSNQDGLQKGVKSGTTWTWTQIPSTTLPFGVAGQGVTFVAADKNGTSTILYAGVRDTTVGGIYKSTDGGTSWTKVSGTSMLTPGRARIAQNGTLYVTSGSPTVAKLTRSGTFTLISTLPTTSIYLGLAVDPNDATDNTVYVAQSNGAGIWYSNNGGSSWLAQGTTFNEGPLAAGNHARREPDGTPSLTGYWFGATSCMLITPANSNQLWLGDFFGVSRTSNATAMGTNPGCWWYTLQKNQEETVVLDLKVPPSGPKLMVGVSDVGGYRYNNTTARPTGTDGNRFDNLVGGNNTSLDFSEANTNVWARGWVNSSGSTGSGAVSSDGGVSWLRFGQVGQSVVTNGPTAGWATWDISTFLARQKAKGLNTVTFAVATNNALNGSPSTNLPFDSREAVDPSVTPRIFVNGTTNLIATADTTVMGGTATQNFGNATTLLCKYYYGDAASSRWIYVKFDLSSVASITSAVLQLHRQASASDTAPFPVGVYYCANNSWIEGDGGTDNLPAGEMTWNNKPACVSNAGGGPQEGPNFYDGATALSGGRIAVSSTNPNVIVWMPINATPRYSTDRGVSWNASTGAPAPAISGIYTNGTSLDISGQNLAADRGNGAFYIATYGGPTDNIYRSTDNGATWAIVGTVNNGGSYNGRTPQIVSAPVSPAFPSGGDVWLCDDGTYNGAGGGLWRSTNSGANWGGISTLGKVKAVTFGKSSTGTGYCVYAAGIKAGVPGIYRSDDYGSNWNLLPTPTIDGLSALAGDRQNYGKVYLGTPGRGTFIGQ